MSMKQYNHTCIKPTCSTSYTDTDPDPYYCESCREQNKKIAEELSKKIPQHKPVKSALQEYDEAPKVHGNFVQVRL